MKLPKWAPHWTLLAFSLALAIGLVAPLRGGGRVQGLLGDSLHAPAFAVLAVLLFRTLVTSLRLQPRTAAWAASLSLVALGAAAEVVQGWVGRSCSLKDFFANGLGAVAGVLWAMNVAKTPSRARRRWRAAAVALLVLGMAPALVGLTDAAIQWRNFPVIASFEQPLERLRWQTFWSKIRRSRQHATDGDWSLRVDLRPGDYPGIGSGALPADWSDYNELTFDVHLDDGPPLDWLVKILDRREVRSSRRVFERRVELRPGSQTIVLPLADVEAGSGKGRLNLSKILYLQLLALELDHERTVHLDNIRLQ